jgi:hypothetical protein
MIIEPFFYLFNMGMAKSELKKDFQIENVIQYYESKCIQKGRYNAW